MARHNRSGSGVDQCDKKYAIDYQPDWLKRVRVTRKLKSGRQSTMSVFRNPSDEREEETGERIRMGATSLDEDLAFEVVLTDPRRAVRSITVTYHLPPGEEAGATRRGRRRPKPREVVFTFEGGLRAPANGGRGRP